MGAAQDDQQYDPPLPVVDLVTGRCKPGKVSRTVSKTPLTLDLTVVCMTSAVVPPPGVSSDAVVPPATVANDEILNDEYKCASRYRSGSSGGAALISGEGGGPCR